MKRRDNRIPRLCSAGADRNAIDSRRLRENVGGGRDEQEEYPPGEHSRELTTLSHRVAGLRMRSLGDARIFAPDSHRSTSKSTISELAR